jgi:hypothetical protein
MGPSAGRLRSYRVPPFSKEHPVQAFLFFFVVWVVCLVVRGVRK